MGDACLLEARDVGSRPPGLERWLLENISLQIRAGERVAVVGPSGAGKTLLLRALALLDPIQAGEIRWRGQVIRRDQVPRFRGQAIYLHQKPALVADTVEAALQRPFALATHRGQHFDPRRAAALLERLGRERLFLSARVRDLSGGESQIVALVRAIELDPVMLLLDEPTASLDAASKRAAEQLLDDWIRDPADQRAMVWITHDAEQARRVSSRVLSMEGGRLLAPEFGPARK